MISGICFFDSSISFCFKLLIYFDFYSGSLSDLDLSCFGDLIIFFVFEVTSLDSSSSSSLSWFLSTIVPFLRKIISEGIYLFSWIDFISWDCWESITNFLASLLQTGHFQVLFFAVDMKEMKVLRSKHCPWWHLCPLTGVLMRSQVKGSLIVTEILSIYTSFSEVFISFWI